MRKNLLWAVFLVGFTSILGQVLLMRELVTIFYGNELIYGLVLALWLLMVAVGSLISGRLVDRLKNKTITFIITQVLIIFILPAQIYFGRVIKPWLGIPQGAMVDLPTTFWIIFLTLAPLTLTLGFQFVLGSKLLSEKLKDTPQEIGEVYIFESIGSLIGGFLFSFIFVYFLSPFQIVGLIILLLAFSAFLLSSPPAGRAGRKEIFLLLLVGLFFIFSNYLENLSSQKLWSGFKLIASLDSPYGRLAVTEDKGEHTFYENGVILFSTADKPLAEELVHLTFLEHKDPKKVLLIGGGAGNVLDEALKYKIERVDYLELDPKVISLARKYLKSESLKSLNDPKVKIYNLDGRYFLNQSSQDYDIILINLPDPSTALLNRFYTLEFFKECKEKLKKDGLLSIHLSTSETYLGRELRNLNANILKTLRQVFPSVEIIPGGYNYFFASKTKNLLTTNKYTLLRRWRNRGIKTAYFNEYALKFLFLPLRIDTVLKAIEPTSLTRINYDFHPISYFYNLLLWSSELKSVLKDILQNLERIKFSHVLTLLLALVFLIKWLSFYSPRGRGLIIPTIVLFVGFTGMTAQIFLIYGFQSLYGYIYHSIGILIACFMAGLALGGFVINRNYERIKNPVNFLALILIGYTAYLDLLAVIFYLRLDLPAGFFPLLTLMAGLPVGAVFPLAIKIYHQITAQIGILAGIIYGIDVAGGSLAAVITSIFMIPILGLINTCLIASVLCLSGLVLLLPIPRERSEP